MDERHQQAANEYDHQGGQEVGWNDSTRVDHTQDNVPRLLQSSELERLAETLFHKYETGFPPGLVASRRSVVLANVG